MTIDTMLKISGAAYGAALIASAFVNNRITGTLRLDRFVFPRWGGKTRRLNLVPGFLALGYYVYALVTGY